MHVARRVPLPSLSLITITWSLTSWFPNGLSAGSPNEAHLTQVNNSVQLLHPMRAPRQGLLSDIVGAKTVVRTGKDSHVELTFSDQTVVRMAGNTAFSFEDGTRDLKLSEGAVLVQAPRSANGATIHAASVAAAITATTVMIEYHPGVCKFLVLEGTGRLYRTGHLGDSVLVHAGQMVIGNPNAAVSDPVDFDIARFVKTSRFIVGLPPLRSEKLIAAESQKQQREKSNKTLIDTNLVIFGGGTRVSLTGQTQTSAAGQTTAAATTPRPTPSPTHEAARASQ
jgi:hypothetical protein